MFDSPESRFIYDYAVSRHSEFVGADTLHGKAYRSGYAGQDYSENPLLSYEHWRAGRDNAASMKPAGG